LVGSSTSVVPGRIERLRNFSRNDEGVAKSIDKHEIGSKKEAESRFLEQNGRYRSWEVDMDDGQKAFQAAKTQWKTADALPKFNLLGGSGGMNCGTWVQSIASVAGIPSTSFMASIGYPIPINEVSSGGAIKSESEMWDSRHG
jgi:hypothetical protein